MKKLTDNLKRAIDALKQVKSLEDLKALLSNNWRFVQCGVSTVQLISILLVMVGVGYFGILLFMATVFFEQVWKTKSFHMQHKMMQDEAQQVAKSVE